MTNHPNVRTTPTMPMPHKTFSKCPITELVSHPEMSALNADASTNIHPMSVTELVSHPEMSALNVDARQNIYLMLVTELVSHPEMSALNADAP